MAASSGAPPAGAYDHDLIVIGAGSGGVRAARTAAGLGARVALCELPLAWVSSDCAGGLGGTCVLRGCVPKKLMLLASQHGASFSDAEAFGWRLGSQPPHDWAVFMEAKRSELLRINKVYSESLARAGVVYLEGRARLVEPQGVEINGSVLKAKSVLVATGTKPSLPKIPGAHLCDTSDTLLDAPSRPQHVVIVGGGYIGVEFAGMLARLGSDVHLAYRDELPLKKFDNEVRAFMARRFAQRNIQLHPHTEPIAVQEQPHEGGQPRRLTLTLQCQQTGKSFELRDLDMVLMAIGRKPRTEGLGLAELGVALNKKGGVAVDDFKHSVSTPWLYALGDVANRINLTPVAIVEGEAVAKTLFDKPTRPDTTNCPSAVFAWPELGTVGLTEEEAARQLDRVEVFTHAFRPMHARICARSTKCAETGGGLRHACAKAAAAPPPQEAAPGGAAPAAAAAAGAAAAVVPCERACQEGVASACAVLDGPPSAPERARAPAGPKEEGKGRILPDEEQAMVKVLVDTDSGRVVGLHMVEPSAPEIMQGFAVALKAGVTKAQLDSTIGIHPTAAEELVQLRRPARIVGRKAHQQQQQEGAAAAGGGPTIMERVKEQLKV